MKITRRQLRKLIIETIDADGDGIRDDLELSIIDADEVAALKASSEPSDEPAKAHMNKDNIPQTLKKLPGGWFKWEDKIKDMVLLGEKEKDLADLQREYPNPSEWQGLASEIETIKTLKNQYFPNWSERDLDELYRQGTIDPKYAPGGYSILAGDTHRHDEDWY